MVPFTVLQIDHPDGNPRLAIMPLPGQQFEPAFLAQITHLLLGNHKDTDRLLYRNILPNTALSEMGAKAYVFVCFFNPPDGGIINWAGLLDEYTPAGWVTTTSGVVFESSLSSPQSGNVECVIITSVKS